jgi:UDP-glucose 6-dehydrogenase
MENSAFGLDSVGCASTDCFATDGRNVLGVHPNYIKVDLINQGNSPIVVTKNSPEYDDVLQRPNQAEIGLVRHCGDGNDLVGERCYALVG